MGQADGYLISFEGATTEDCDLPVTPSGDFLDSVTVPEFTPSLTINYAKHVRYSWVEVVDSDAKISLGLAKALAFEGRLAFEIAKTALADYSPLNSFKDIPFIADPLEIFTPGTLATLVMLVDDDNSLQYLITELSEPGVGDINFFEEGAFESYINTLRLFANLLIEHRNSTPLMNYEDLITIKEELLSGETFEVDFHIAEDMDCQSTFADVNKLILLRIYFEKIREDDGFPNFYRDAVYTHWLLKSYLQNERFK